MTCTANCQEQKVRQAGQMYKYTTAILKGAKRPCKTKVKELKLLMQLHRYKIYLPAIKDLFLSQAVRALPVAE